MMTDQLQIWQTAQETMQAFTPFYQEEMGRIIAEKGPQTGWFALHLARGAEPEPLTMQRFLHVVPYGNPEQGAHMFNELVETGFVAATADGYRLTSKGRTAVEDVFDVAHSSIGAAPALDDAEMAQAVALLERLVAATLAAPEPEAKWSLRYSRWTDPGAAAAANARIDQYITDLYRYRDDAHVAAWQPHGVSGQAWEALTFVWRDEADTAAALGEKLANRGYTADQYAEALAQLVQRGWLVEENGRYALTDAGRRVREDAEAATNRHFFVGWQALDENELEQLHVLLTRLTERLRAAVATAEVAPEPA